MGEQTSLKPLASNKEQMRVPLRQRLQSYVKTWWYERGGPEGVAGKAVVVKIADRIVRGW